MGIADFIREPECKNCETLREWLDEEKAKRDYYERLFLTKIGAIQEDTKEEADVEYPSVSRMTTLSSIRRHARQVQHNRRPVIDELAPKETLTEAEILFEKSLNG